MSINFTNIYYLSNTTPDYSYLTDIINLQVIIVTVAFPLIIQVVNRIADRYQDREIANFVTEEPLYAILFYSLFINLILALTLKFLLIFNEKFIVSFVTNHYILGIIYAWSIVNIILFLNFIRLIIKYSVKTDDVLIAKMRKHVKNIFEE